MANIIRVEPSQLTAAAGRFENTAGQIKNTTANMTQTVGQLSGRVWSGQAASAYVNKFNGLQGDMNQMFQMIQKHSNHLKEIAREYETKESENVAESGSLSSDVI